MKLRGMLLAMGLTGFASAYDLITDASDVYVVSWAPGNIPMKLMLPTSPTLADGTNLTTSLQAALGEWNAQIGIVQFTSSSVETVINPPAGTYESGNGINEVVIDSTYDGEDFGTGTLAITLSYRIGNTRDESDVVFNSVYDWQSYRGAKQTGTQDIRRVALHELGHALGLDHPDEAGQSVTAIMNSHVSYSPAIDTVQADDINGARSMYGAPGFVPANNGFANAVVLSLAGNAVQASGTNVAATKEAGEPNHANVTGGHSVWWKWTASANGTATISTFGSNFDTALGVYTGSAVSSLSGVVSNDDEDPPGSGNPQRKRTSKVTLSALGGTTYYLGIDGRSGYMGSIVVSISFAPTVVQTPPSITSQPASATVVVGQSAQFMVAANGSPTPGFQWQRMATGGGAWSDLSNVGSYSGVTTATLAVSNAALGMNGDQFRCVASNSAGSATSNAVTLAVGSGSGDFNTDGHPDILLENAGSGQRVLWLMGGPNSQYVTVGLDLGFLDAAWHIVGTADFSGDGKPDILLENTGSGQRVLWLMGGPNNQFVTQGLDMGFLNPAWHIVGVADFSGDGKPDILLENTGSGQRVLWLMGGPNNQFVIQGLDLGFLDAAWHIVAVADFSGDGKPDILLENGLSGQRVLWLMGGPNNQFVTQGLDLGFLDPAWHIVHATDFNADGHPDILLENRSSGQRVLWIMGGPNSQYVTLGLDLGFLDANWRIVN